MSWYKIEEKKMDLIASKLNSEYECSGDMLKRLLSDLNRQGEVEIYTNVIE